LQVKRKNLRKFYSQNLHNSEKSCTFALESFDVSFYMTLSGNEVHDEQIDHPNDQSTTNPRV